MRWHCGVAFDAADRGLVVADILRGVVHHVKHVEAGVFVCGAVAVRGEALHVLEEAVVGEEEIGSLGDEASHDGRVDEVVDPPEDAVVHDPRKKGGEGHGLDDQREVVGGVDEIGVVEVAAVHRTR